MTDKVRLAFGNVVLLATLLSTTGCALSVPVWEDREPARGRNSVIHAEVRSVDSRSSQIHLREERGRNVTVRFDRRTAVVHRQRTVPVTSLERGDRVSVRVANDRRGQALAQRVDLIDPAWDRGRANARVERFAGTVAWVDTRRGEFALATNRGPALIVTVPRSISRADQNRFERLNRGDRIQVDVQLNGRDGYTLVRFR